MKKTLFFLFVFCSFLSSLSAYEDTQDEEYRVVLTARHRTILSSQVSSVVSKIHKKMGEKFSKSDNLLQLDDVVFYAEETKALSILEKAKVRLEATQRLFKDNASSLLELKEAEVDLAAAEAELVHATKTLSACSILAPYDGEVVGLFTDLHQMVQPGNELLEIIESSTLIGKILLPSQYLPYIEKGKQLEVYIEEINKKVMGTISNIGAVIDPVSGMVKVFVEVDNKNNSLKPGMIGISKLSRG